jgi:hypothetical protein
MSHYSSRLHALSLPETVSTEWRRRDRISTECIRLLCSLSYLSLSVLHALSLPETAPCLTHSSLFLFSLFICVILLLLCTLFLFLRLCRFRPNGGIGTGFRPNQRLTQIFVTGRLDIVVINLLVTRRMMSTCTSSLASSSLSSTVTFSSACSSSCWDSQRLSGALSLGGSTYGASFPAIRLVTSACCLFSSFAFATPPFSLSSACDLSS